MNTEKLQQLPYRKPAIAVIALVLGITAGYAVSTTMQPEQQVSYCQGLEQDLVQEYNTTAINCHEPGWVILAAENQEVENQTDMRCVCTRIQDGSLTIFPIRVAG